MLHGLVICGWGGSIIRILFFETMFVSGADQDCLRQPAVIPEEETRGQNMSLGYRGIGDSAL